MSTGLKPTVLTTCLNELDSSTLIDGLLVLRDLDGLIFNGNNLTKHVAAYEALHLTESEECARRFIRTCISLRKKYDQLPKTVM